MRSGKPAVFWIVTVVLLLAVAAAPALSTIFAPPGSVITKSLAKNAVTSPKIKNGAIVNADVAGTAAIAASKINRTGLDADKLDAKHASDFVQKTGNQTMAGSLTAAWFNYGAPRTNYVSIPSAALSPVNSSTAYLLDSSGALTWTGGGSGVFRAPVNLPNGVTITNFRLQGWDNLLGANCYIYAYLDRWSTSTPSAFMATVFSGGINSPAWFDRETTSITSPNVANEDYNYYLEVQITTPTPNIKFGGATIGYTEPGP